MVRIVFVDGGGAVRPFSLALVVYSSVARTSSSLAGNATRSRIASNVASVFGARAPPCSALIAARRPAESSFLDACWRSSKSVLCAARASATMVGCAAAICSSRRSAT